MITVILWICLAAFGLRGIDRSAIPWLGWMAPEHMGAEYNSIARAIVAGRGFSDPFRWPTGPTAWMPPVLPYLLAAWLHVGGPRIAMVLFLTMNYAAAGFFAWCVVREGRRLRCSLAGYAVVIASLLANFEMLLAVTHDPALLLPVYTAIWLGASRLAAGGSLTIRRGVAWGLFGGFAALCSPVAGWSWMIATLFSCLSRRMTPAAEQEVALEEGLVTRRSGRWAFVAAAVLASILAVTPWMVRNRLVMGRWLPIKSNGMYELWQSQLADGDGVLDASAVRRHPWSSDGEERARYAEVGEIAFIDEKAAEVRRAIAEDPAALLVRIAYRSLAAVAVYQPFSKGEYAHRNYVWFKRSFHPLPLLSLLALMLLARRPLDPRVSAAAVIWVAALLPYVLVSYYERYGVPLLTVEAVLMLHAWTMIKRWVGRMGIGLR